MNKLSLLLILTHRRPSRLHIPLLLLHGVILHHPGFLAFGVHQTKRPITLEPLFASLHHVIEVLEVVLISEIETESYGGVNLRYWHFSHLGAVVSLPISFLEFYLGVCCGFIIICSLKLSRICDFRAKRSRLGRSLGLLFRFLGKSGK